MKKRRVEACFIPAILPFLCTILLFPTASGAKEAPDETKALNEDAAKHKQEEADKSEEKWGGKKRDHAKQGFVSIMPGTGYFLVAPYDKDALNRRCQNSEDNPGPEGEPVCSGRSGWHLDMSAGYGLKPGLELFLLFRLGLERPDNDGLLNQPKARQLGLGVKIYSPKDGFFKIGFGAALLVDFSDHGPAAGVRNDLVIHVPIQAQFDIFPWFGPYAQISPNISFISEFRLEFTGGIGVQGRFP